MVISINCNPDLRLHVVLVVDYRYVVVTGFSDPYLFRPSDPVFQLEKKTIFLYSINHES